MQITTTTPDQTLATFTAAQLERLSLLIALLFVLAACSGGAGAEVSDGRPVRSSVPAPTTPATSEPTVEPVVVETTVPEAAPIPEAAPVEVTLADDPDATDDDMEVDPEPAIVLTTPESIGAIANRVTAMSVVTSVGDDLNVRQGPGVQYAIVSTLEHERAGIIGTHRTVLESGATWRFIEVDGAPTGWVNGHYLTTTDTSSAACEAPDDLPTFEGAAGHVQTDMDADGIADDVFLLVDPASVGDVHNQDAWVVVSFANGGIAAGRWTGHFSPSAAAGVTARHLSSDGTGIPELLLGIGTGASHAQFGVMARSGCQIVPTVVDGEPFMFSAGASVGYATLVGCAYGAHGEIGIIETRIDNNAQTWSTTVWSLDDNVWTELDHQEHEGFEAQNPHENPTLEDCA